MSDFSQEIYNFQQYGEYTYQFDNVGNMTFDSSSVNFNQVYLAFPLQNVIYNPNKISTLYNIQFEEFIPAVVEPVIDVNGLQQQLDIIEQENITLKTQLDSLISNSNSNSTAADQESAKQVIFELRKALGQGRVDSDFSDTFPYTPIIKIKR